MAALTWNEALALQQPRMDHTHREFVELLAGVEEALGLEREELVDRLAGFVAHTEAHFAQEERWMASLGFAAENCHAFQHGHVLQVLRAVEQKLADEGDVDTVALLVKELGQWFVVHAQSMDAALAETMAERGFDPEMGCLSAASTPAASAPSGSTAA
jgi:hemerythrin-like metal-binding protein